MMFDQLKNGIKNIFGGKGEGGDGDAPVFEDELVDLVDREFKRRQEEKRPFELQMRLNLCMYEGQQYLDINTSSMSLEEMPVIYEWQEREVFNHIAPNIETRISKLKRMRTVPKVKPGGIMDQADRHGAKVGTHVLKNWYHDLSIPDKQAEELIWSEICGTVFRKHIWNPNLGEVIGQMQDENGEVQEVREGDEEIIVVPPQEMYPDSCYHDDMEECKSIIHARAFDVDDIEETWGVRVAPEKAETEKLERAKNGLGGLGYGQGGFMVHTVKLEHHAIVKEYMERPSKKYPEGRLIIVAGGKLLHAGPLPYKVDDDQKPGFPFSMLVCLKRPGVFWGKTVLERLIPVQRRYNALRNRKAEYLNRAAIGQWDVVEGSVDLDAFEMDAGMPGSVTEYRQGTNPPRMRDNPPLPHAFDTEEQSLLNEFAILSGVSEVSRDSSVPSGIKSGVAISFLQEQDDTRLSNTAENIERFTVHSGKVQLRLAKQFVTMPRTLHIVGENNVAEVIDWMGNELTSENVYIESASALTESPAQKRQMVFDMLEAGLLLDPDTGKLTREMRTKIFEMLEFGEWESGDDDDQLQIAKAERENKMMEQGSLPLPRNFDDHIVHLSRLNKYRLTTEYEELIAQNPAIDQIFQQHADMHMMSLMQAQMGMMQQQAPGEPAEGQEQHSAA